MGFAGCVCWTCQIIVCVNYQTDVIRVTSWKNSTSLLIVLLTIHWISLAGLPTSTHYMQHIILSQHYLKGIHAIHCNSLELDKIKPSCYIAVNQLCWLFKDLQFFVFLLSLHESSLLVCYLHINHLHDRHFFVYTNLYHLTFSFKFIIQFYLHPFTRAFHLFFSNTAVKWQEILLHILETHGLECRL